MDIILSIYIQNRLKRTTQALLKISAADAIEAQVERNDGFEKLTVKIGGYLFAIFNLGDEKFKITLAR